MKLHIKPKDVFNTPNTVVDMGNPFEFQFLVSQLSPQFYNAGTYGWNYDVYDFKGFRFLYGDRTPTGGRQNWSTKILRSLARASRAISFSDENWTQRKDECLEKFCESIRKGIHDPEPVTSYGNFKRQLVEQKGMFPEESFASIAKELLDNVPYKRKKEVEGKIRAGLLKDASFEGLSEASFAPTPSLSLESALEAVAKKETARALKTAARESGGIER